jgi:hypothetical protein
MSYCRFENTYKDLMDCYEALCDEDTELSEEEIGYYHDMLEVCRDMISWSGENEPKKEQFQSDDDE